MVQIVKYVVRYFRNNAEISKIRKDKGKVIFGKNILVQNGRCICIDKGSVIGDNSKLLCTVGYNGELFDIQPQLHIGKNFHSTRNLTIQCARKVIIGDNVLCASNVFVIDYNHGTNPMSENYLDNDLEISEGVNIKDGVWIGNNVIILGNVTIGEKAIIAAGAVVTHGVPPYTIVAGNPARIIKVYNHNLGEWTKVNDKIIK